MHDLVSLVDLAPPRSSFRDDVLAGLSAPRKSIPCKYLYDARGAALFEEICRTPEYYPTRTEIGILRRAGPEIARLVGPGARVIEFGSGAGVKTRILLDALDAPSMYIPVDISREQLREAAGALALRYPGIEVMAVCADYTADDFEGDLPRGGRRLAFFPGSTVGNFEPDAAEDFLARCARLVGRGGGLLIGVDLVKDEATLDAAYNDAAGVTAAFSLNLLTRMNRELGADFDLARFEHEAFYAPRARRIEIYIRSLEDQVVRVAGRAFRFAAGERIHTEHSYKHTLESFRALAAAAGFAPVRAWTDDAGLFSVHLLRAA